MKLRVYAGQTCFIVVPEFLLPPSATARYEPLIFQGYLEDSELDPDDIDIIRKSIARYHVAILPDPVCGRLNVLPA